ncbi:MAG: PEP-CTERM sorting domain-containing protein [Sedimentisphaerales bacterium]|nr:PEP-CTERM sorting domain-containing protein [Sedimentisphaerales bacterium]MBN2842146.1 PEP-CTERM sorting domain-containing protein [Sedimentisphaerales bacterium]
MKKIVWLVIICFMSAANAGVLDDGKLTAGEYGFSVEIGDKNSLVVDGGGSNSITMNNYSHLDVLSSSLPLSSGTKGVWTIYMNDYSTLNFSGGATNLITTKKNSMAYLSGGQINLIASQQVVTDKEHIIIDCKPNWIWKRNSYNEIKGIVGYWHDGAAFDITFLDQTNFGYNPVYENVKVIPEPGTLALLSLGSLFLKRRIK